MRYFSEGILTSGLQGPDLDLLTSMNDEGIQERTNFRPLLIYVQSHVVAFVRISAEAFGKVRHEASFGRLPFNAEHSVN
jgi:hypothetical protein